MQLSNQQHPSIARKLAIGLTLVLVLFWLFAVAIGGLMFRHEMDEAFDESLQQAAIRLLPLAVHDLTEEEGERVEYSISGNIDPRAAFQYSIVDPSGKTVLNSDVENQPTNLSAKPLGFSREGRDRFFSLVDPESQYRIIIVERSGHRDEALLESLFGLLLPLGALVPFAGFGIWFAIRRAMRPLEQLSTDIAERGSRDLSPLNVERQPEELKPIAQSVADLMDRLRIALQAERTFAANSAHELRTPLAGALAQVQRLSIEIENGAGSDRVKEIDQALRNLANLSEQVLQLSRLDAGFAKSEKPVQLNSVLDLVIRDFQSDTKMDNEICLHNEADHILFAHITQDAFAVIMRNLIQNAIKHGISGRQILIKLHSDQSLSVLNEAKTVARDQLNRISEPFERGTTKAEGSGLGLSIVRTVMEQCGGELSLHSPAVQHSFGFEAKLSFAPISNI